MAPRPQVPCAFALTAALALALVGPSCGGSPRDVAVAPPSTSASTPAGAGSAQRGGGYLHVARRALAMVALASADGLPPEVAIAATSHLANALDGCATDLGRAGKLVQGAARLTATISDEGMVDAVALTVAPGSAVKAQALLCLVSPAKLLSFPAKARALGELPGARVLVVEATWGFAGPADEGPSNR